jgi:DNA-binding response OmpR family regulator
MNILVIEDEPRVAKAIKRSLSANGYVVDIEHDSSRALSKALKLSNDLIILDLMLPGPYSGIDIVKMVRKEGVNTPLLILTALGEVTDKVTGLQVGADDYLVKPFSMKELIARVQVLLRRPKKQIGSILKVADLELNSETFGATRSDVPIKLSVREYKLLHYLMYNRGQILSKQRIINHVWDGDTLIMPNTVEVYMGYLRKKIDKNFPSQPTLIHTVFGFGYMIGDNNKDV